MNYMEATKFVQSNTPERIAEKLTQLSMKVKELNSEIHGDEYWLKFYIGNMLANPEYFDFHNSELVKLAKNMIEDVKELKGK